MGGENRRAKSLRNGVHHANAVVWGPVRGRRTRLFRRGDSPSKRVSNVRQLAPRLETDRQRPRLSPSLDALRAPNRASTVDGRVAPRGERARLGPPAREAASRSLPPRLENVARFARVASRVRQRRAKPRDLFVLVSRGRLRGRRRDERLGRGRFERGDGASKPRGLFVLLRRVSVACGSKAEFKGVS